MGASDDPPDCSSGSFGATPECSFADALEFFRSFLACDGPASIHDRVRLSVDVCHVAREDVVAVWRAVRPLLEEHVGDTTIRVRFALGVLSEMLARASPSSAQLAKNERIRSGEADSDPETARILARLAALSQRDSRLDVATAQHATWAEIDDAKADVRAMRTNLAHAHK